MKERDAYWLEVMKKSMKDISGGDAEADVIMRYGEFLVLVELLESAEAKLKPYDASPGLTGEE